MADVRMPESIRSIVKLERDADGYVGPVELYRRASGGKRKGTRLLRPLDRAVRRMARAQEEAASVYLERHAKSNTKKRDGWLRDLGNNVYRASRRGQKELKLERLLFP
jgi:hypothetical protein